MSASPTPPPPSSAPSSSRQAAAAAIEPSRPQCSLVSSIGGGGGRTAQCAADLPARTEMAMAEPVRAIMATGRNAAAPAKRNVLTPLEGGAAGAGAGERERERERAASRVGMSRNGLAARVVAAGGGRGNDRSVGWS